ncbi:hypothetical protein Peur_024407 [Populus x canadensis]
MGKMFSSFAKSIQLLLLCFSLANFLDHACADPPYKGCSKNSSYSANSPFQNNLEILMSSLRSNASVSKLYNTSTGNELDRIYAQYMCLNYVTHDECSTCIKVASQTITRLCPGDKEAVVWEELCQLRYSSQNFLAHLDVSGNIPQHNKNDVKNPVQFRSVVNEALDNLIKQAASNASANMYATTEVPFNDTYTLYALVQCSTDLSPDDCNTCLRVSLANIWNCCYASRGVRVLSRSCYLRYELYAFYEVETTLQKKASVYETEIWMIIILTVAGALLVVVILGFFLVKRNGIEKWKKENTRQLDIGPGIGRPNRCDFQIQSLHRDGLNAWPLWNEGNELLLIDSLLADSCCLDEFSRYMHIGLLCVQEDFGGRPTMSSVVSMLKNESSTLPKPKRPGFFAWTFTGHCEASASKCSVNGLTISDILPR